MGCVNTKVENEETLRRCRERKRLMKQLISSRAELATAHLAYLRSLKNIGSTLRQFAEVESSMNLESGIHPPPGLYLPPSPPPPPPLPPSPPPQFVIAPRLPKPEIQHGEEEDEKDEEFNANKVDINDNNDDESGVDDDDGNDSLSSPPPPVQVHGSAWEFWDPFGPPSSLSSSIKGEGEEEEEDWAEANADFREEEDHEQEKGEGKDVGCAENVVLEVLDEGKLFPLAKELMDDTSSAVSPLTKDTTDMALVVWRTKKSLAVVVKEIDDYFLKAAAAGSEVVLLLELNRGPRVHWDSEQVMGKSSKSAKVFSALSWNWSLKSPQSSKGLSGHEASDVSKLSNHSATLERIYAKEQMLYKEVKEEELAKVLHRKKTLLLHKLEARDCDCTKIEQIRLNIENLQSQIISLQDSISETCLSISSLRDEELYPQLTELTIGLMQMWRAMYECHQVQNHIAQQANLLDRHPGCEPTTDAHRLATAQLETEVTCWYSSFCNLLRSQRHYVYTLNHWLGLTDCLPDTYNSVGSPYGIRALCEEWQLVLDRLPDKVAAEAIKSLVSVIHSIILQQKEECNLEKKSHRLESRLEKELTSFSDSLEKHEEENSVVTSSRRRLDGLKKRVEEEKAKYLNSVRNSRAMTLNNLQTSLPNVFQALMGFAGVCVQAFEDICRPPTTTTTGAAAAGPHQDDDDIISSF